MRIGIAGLLHESNSFMPATTTRDDFVRTSLDVGNAIVAKWRESHHEVAGFLEGAERFDFEPVALFVAVAVPSGPLTAEAFDGLVAELLARLNSAGRLDGLLLALHGATVAASHRDADGEIVTRLRRQLGPALPIVMTLDLHANVSERMVAGTTAAVYYRSNPHLDQRQRGLEAAEIITRTVRGEIRPVQALEKPPMLIKNMRQYTGAEPAASLFRDLDAVLAWPGILSASVAMGYNHADVEELGPSFLAVADADADLARKAAAWMAARAWERREDFGGDLPGAADAVREATLPREPAAYPVVLMDVGDNVGGGAPGDSTVLFEEIIRQGESDALVVLHDPAAVRQCLDAGVRCDVDLAVGGRGSAGHCNPVRIRGKVRVLADGMFIEDEPRHGGRRFNDQGITAVVETQERHTVVLTTERMAPFSLGQLLSLGIRPENKRILVVKGVVAPRAAYETIAARTILVDTPGATSTNLTDLDYKFRRRPLFPLEREATYMPGGTGQEGDE